ncbi:MAG: PIN domain-containing protein [Pyrinomonadaceae bacterium]|nr:PIN domain-containing protein [Phycisphaerales bacterium]
MIAIDTNILVYAHRRDSEFHSRAVTSIRSLAEGSIPWAIPWPCLHEFVAIATHPRIFSPPTSLDAALKQIEYWMESPSLMLLAESTGYWGTLRQTLSKCRVAGPQVHDARIAALCIDHGVKTLWSADRDFSRFTSLHVVNPLHAPAT